MTTRVRALTISLLALVTLQACGGDGDSTVPTSGTEATPLSCDAITTAAIGLQGVTIGSSQLVSSGSLTPPGSTTALTGLPSFCRVVAVLKPTASSNINVEVWMPTTWNGKLVTVGNGGLAGTISYSDMAPALAKGYATASTDTGHVASDTTWLPDAQKQYEYMTGSIHETTMTAKGLVKRFYGKQQTRAYYQGCSTGGGQGFSAVQRFPADYDGAIAGAPQNFPTHFRPALISNWQAANASAAGGLPVETMANVTKAVLNQCGGAAASADGFLMNPQACNFDPASMQCGAGQSGNACLTPGQVSAVRQIYAGLKAPSSGVLMWPGLAPGSEQPSASGLGWQAHGTAGGNPFSTASLFFRIGVLQQPNFDLKTMDFDSTVRKGDALFGDILNSINPDIRSFTSRGGKLLMYHGWADMLISPQNSINYYESMVETVGSRQETEKSARLFMVPGMGHCSGGPGATVFDTLQVLDQWVEKDQAPSTISASSTTTPAFTRPLCPYPKVAEYSGSGDRSSAASWQCVGRTPIADTQFYRRGMNIF